MVLNSKTRRLPPRPNLKFPCLWRDQRSLQIFYGWVNRNALDFPPNPWSTQIIVNTCDIESSSQTKTINNLHGLQLQTIFCCFTISQFFSSKYRFIMNRFFMVSFAVKISSIFLPWNLAQNVLSPIIPRGSCHKERETHAYKTQVKVQQERVRPRSHYAG